MNSELLKLARQNLERSKLAFQPPMPGGDPAAMGGMPPGGDPMAAGGAMPPDPSMGGGAMPMDPAAMGGDPNASAMGTASPVTMEGIQQMMQQMMTQMQQGGGAAGAGAKQVKPDIVMVANDVYQIKRLLLTMFENMSMPVPQDVLLGAGRDAQTGLPTDPNSPNATNNMPAQPSGGQGGGEGGQPPEQNPGAIQPIGGMMGATPTPKTAASFNSNKIGMPNHYQSGKETKDKAAALKAIMKQRKLKTCT